ncbi:LETM1 domain-containing protein 1-like isoform X1 [Montipora foliosa]|uniref:LETM1 domain-containing protein 1-like isoform X1 n=1 Tax=Montipora foliosa TaxID=591990 RepID=UPI0035F1998A
MTVALSLCCSRVSASHHHRLHKVAFNHVRVAASSLNRLRENQASHFSTTCSNSTRGDSRIQKLGKVVAAFVGGSKQLGKDVKLMFEIQKKLKNNSYNWDILKTEEIIHLHQTRKDLLKSLPVVVAFFIPFLGYVVPFVAFLYPKQLLSRHYWQPHQKEKFVIQDITRRRRHYLPLVREVGRLALGYKAHSQSEDLMSTSVKVVEKQHPSNQELLNAVEFFKGELLSFDYLPRYHLKKLSHVWLISPWLPNRFLRSRLKRILKSVKKEDAALKRVGFRHLHEEQLKAVCHSRGLDTTDVDPEALVQWLADWVELSNAAGDTDESFMAHCAVFKTMNYKSDKDVHIRQTR